jgi:hypothetical protein
LPGPAFAAALILLKFMVTPVVFFYRVTIFAAIKALIKQGKTAYLLRRCKVAMR